MKAEQISTGRSLIPIGAFLGGTGVSLIGNVMAGIALPWFVLQTTGSASQTGLTGFATALPMAMSGVLGGPLIDRLGGKKMSVISDVVSAAAIFAVPLLHRLDLLTFPLLLLLVFLGALLDIPGLTARRMLLPGFAKRTGLRPEQMNSSFEVLTGISGLLGPAVAGILIAPMGAVNLLWITGAGFLLSAMAVYGVVPDPPAPEPEAVGAPPGYIADIREGLAFLYSEKVLLALAVLFGSTNFVSGGFFSVGLPVFAHDHWQSAARLGFLFTALGTGNMLGAALYGVFGHRLRHHRRTVILCGFVPQAVLIAQFIWSTNFSHLVMTMFFMGFLAGPSNPLAVTVRFERIPMALRGRVFATFSAISSVISPLGVVLTGLMVEATSLRTGMVVIAVAYGAIAIMMLVANSLHGLNEIGPYADSESP